MRFIKRYCLIDVFDDKIVMYLRGINGRVHAIYEGAVDQDPVSIKNTAVLILPDGRRLSTGANFRGLFVTGFVDDKGIPQGVVCIRNNTDDYDFYGDYNKTGHIIWDDGK